MSGYFSQRNTNAREHNFYGSGVRVPVEGPRGPSGPVGPAGPRGRDGADGDPGTDVSARKFIVLSGWRDYGVQNVGSLPHLLGIGDASPANMTNNLAYGEEPFVWCYSNYVDMEHRLYASWTTANGPHSSVIPSGDTNYPYLHSTWDRYIGFRVTPGVWKCSAFLGDGNQRTRWFLDKDKNRVNTPWNGETEYRSYQEPGLGFNYAIITVPPGGDMMIAVEQNNHSGNTYYARPVFHLECLAEFAGTDGPAIAYPGYSTAWAPKWRQIAFPNLPRLTICN